MLLRRLLRYANSSRVAFWLMLSWLALVLVWVLPFIVTGQSEATVEAIAQDWLPFRMTYVLLGLVTVVCSISRFRRERSRKWDAALARRLETDWEDASSSRCSLEDATRALESRRFGVQNHSEDSVVLVRNEHSVYGGALFHIGIVLVGVSLLVHGVTIAETSFDLIEGQSVADSFAMAGAPESQAALYSPLQDIVLTRVEPRFFGPYLLFERLDAQVSDGGRVRRMSLARPLWVDPITNLSIQDFDVAPRFVTSTEDGEVQEDAAVAMDLFPPGSDRTTHLDVAKADVTLRLYTDYDERDGEPVSGSYNLENVRFAVTVVSKVAGVPDRVVMRRVLGVGDSFTVNDFTVTIKDLKTVGTFRVLRAPGMPLVLLSVLVALAGLASRILFRRVDVMLRRSGEGVAYVAHEDLLGRDWGERGIAQILSAEEPDA